MQLIHFPNQINKFFKRPTYTLGHKCQVYVAYATLLRFAHDKRVDVPGRKASVYKERLDLVQFSKTLKVPGVQLLDSFRNTLIDNNIWKSYPSLTL